MAKRYLVALILGVPVVAFSVAQGLMAYYRPIPALRELSDYSIMAGAAGLAVLGLIRTAAGVAQGNRWALVFLFRPGLYATVVALMILVSAHAYLAVAALYFLEASVIGRIHVGIMFGIGLGAMLGIWLMARAVFSIVGRASATVVGERVPREGAPGFWALIDDVCEKTNSLSPDHLVVGLDPSFFVTEADVTCIGGHLHGRTLFCSLPLCRLLTVEEFKGVVAHEMAHFAGDDTVFSQRFYPVYGGASKSLAALASAGGSDIALLPAFAILGYFLECFSIAERTIGREREIVADSEGARQVGPSTFGSALVKVHAYSLLWTPLERGVVDLLKQGKMLANCSTTFRKMAEEASAVLDVSDFLGNSTSHPTDTHPTLEARLNAMGLEPAELQSTARHIHVTESAASVLSDPEAVEERISGVHQEYLARQAGILLRTSSEDDLVEGQEADRAVPVDRRSFETKWAEFSSKRDEVRDRLRAQLGRNPTRDEVNAELSN